LKLTKEQNRLNEIERTLQERKLELDRRHHRLFSIERSLRNEARAMAISLPDEFVVQSPVSGRLRNENLGFLEAAVGCYRSGLGESLSSMRSRSLSSCSESLRPSLDRLSLEHSEISSSNSH